MRSAGDYRPAAVLKAELLAGLVAPESVALVIDDDPVVCAALRRAGYRVRCADWAPDPPN